MPSDVMPPAGLSSRLARQVPAAGARSAEKIAFDLDHPAELAGTDHPLEFRRIGIEPPVVANRDLQAVRRQGLQCLGGFGCAQAERFLTVNMLAGVSRRQDLLKVHGVGRGQHHRIDIVVRQQIVKGFIQTQTGFPGVIHRPGQSPGGAGDEANHVTATRDGLDQCPPPAAHAHDPRVDHPFFSTIGLFQ